MGLLELLIVILVIVWLAGMFGPGDAPAYRTSGLIHVVLVIAVVILLFRLLGGVL